MKKPEPKIIETFIETVKKRGLTYKEAADQLNCRYLIWVVLCTISLKTLQ
jgi:hypothetical protein